MLVARVGRKAGVEEELHGLRITVPHALGQGIGVAGYPHLEEGAARRSPFLPHEPLGLLGLIKGLQLVVTLQEGETLEIARKAAFRLRPVEREARLPADAESNHEGEP